MSTHVVFVVTTWGATVATETTKPWPSEASHAPDGAVATVAIFCRRCRTRGRQNCQADHRLDRRVGSIGLGLQKLLLAKCRPNIFFNKRKCTFICMSFMHVYSLPWVSTCLMRWRSVPKVPGSIPLSTLLICRAFANASGAQGFCFRKGGW